MIRVVLDDGDGTGIAAVVHLARGERESAVRCYPPDALALALRERVPVYAAAEALAHAAAPPATGADPTVRWLEDVRPSDFGTSETSPP